MEGYPSAENPISLTKALIKIENSGFDGVLQYIEDVKDKSIKETKEIIKSPLKLALSCRGYNLEDIRQKIQYAAKYKAEFINILVIGYFIRGEEALILLRKILDFGKQFGVKVFIETHRGTITQDLNVTIDYLKTIEDLKLTIDLSHYVLAGEMDVTNDLIEDSFDQLLQRTASIHVRVSNGQQVQVSTEIIDEEQLNNFKRWWTKGLIYSSKDENTETIPVVIELGPHPYQLKVQGNLDSDRYLEAERWMKYFRDLI